MCPILEELRAGDYGLERTIRPIVMPALELTSDSIVTGLQLMTRMGADRLDCPTWRPAVMRTLPQVRQRAGCRQATAAAAALGRTAVEQAAAELGDWVRSCARRN